MQFALLGVPARAGTCCLSRGTATNTAGAFPSSFLLFVVSPSPPLFFCVFYATTTLLLTVAAPKSRQRARQGKVDGEKSLQES